jgi:hypothetical protein
MHDDLMIGLSNPAMIALAWFVYIAVTALISLTAIAAWRKLSQKEKLD